MSRKSKRQHARTRHLNKLMIKYENKCAYCNMILSSEKDDYMNPNYATIDHIIPLELGGLNLLHNLCICCDKCNRLKKDFALYSTPFEHKGVEKLKIYIKNQLKNNGRVDLSKNLVLWASKNDVHVGKLAMYVIRGRILVTEKNKELFNE